MPTPEIECIIPILQVRDLNASIDYYTRALGFSIDWKTQTLVSLSRDGRAIMVCAVAGRRARYCGYGFYPTSYHVNVASQEDRPMNYGVTIFWRS